MAFKSVYNELRDVYLSKHPNADIGILELIRLVFNWSYTVEGTNTLLEIARKNNEEEGLSNG